MGADRKANTRAGGALELRDHASCLEDLAASAEAPLSPMRCTPRLQSVGRWQSERQACQWALTQKRTLWGGGALEVGDHRLLEDGSERGGALVSDVVDRDTASEG